MPTRLTHQCWARHGFQPNEGKQFSRLTMRRLTLPARFQARDPFGGGLLDRRVNRSRFRLLVPLAGEPQERYHRWWKAHAYGSVLDVLSEIRPAVENRVCRPKGFNLLLGRFVTLH